MPIEPPPSDWVFPPPTHASPDGLLAIGADLEPGTLLAAYRSGIFPMPLDDPASTAWLSPDPRGLIELGELRDGRTLRRAARRFEISTDRAFDAVLRGCADPRRPGGWITPAMARAYARLHELGWAHAIEVWTADGELAGGLYGVEIGGLFAAESKFHARRDASKVALLALVERLRAAGGPRLLDVQWSTPHLARLGAREVARPEYLRRLAAALELPPAF